MPESFVSDRDIRFTSLFFKTLLSILGARQKMSTSFHPQTDGQTERVIRLTEETLRHYVSFTQNDWDAQLQMVAFAINNAKNVSTSYTPFYLNKGLHPRVPGICSFPAADDMEPRAVSFSVRMQDTIANARKCLAAAQSRWKASLDPKRGDISFVKGDMVLLSTKNLKIKNDQRVISRHKLLPKFIGPYEVAECVGKVSYRLKLPITTRIHNVFHVSLLRAYKGQPEELEDTEMPAPLDWLDPDPLFAVHSIVDHQACKLGKKRSFTYLVHWAGFDKSHDSWHPREALYEHVQNLIETYDLTHGLGASSIPPPSIAGKTSGRQRQKPAKLRD